MMASIVESGQPGTGGEHDELGPVTGVVRSASTQRVGRRVSESA